MNTISTGIEALDRLLGNKGIPCGSSVLVNGKPGSGKTTLALQIASHLLRALKSFRICYLALEEPSRLVIDRFNSSYANNAFPAAAIGTQLVLKDLGEVTTNADPISTTWNQDAFEQLNLYWSDEIWGNNFDLVIIDSFSALFDFVRRLFPETEMSNRKIMSMINSWAFKKQESSKSIESGEPSREIGAIVTEKTRLPSTPQRNNDDPVTTSILVSEPTESLLEHDAISYLSDFIIDLGHEEISPIRDAQTYKEPLLRCSVRKGRGVPIQRRKCTYEFVPNKGMVFYETYPAEGLISLFFENQIQREQIEILETVDVPALYPSLNVQAFDTSALQRMFAVRRRLEEIPQRKSMVLCNIDEYWVRTLVKRRGPDCLLEPVPKGKLKLYSQDDFELLPELIAMVETKQFYQNDYYYAVPHFINFGLIAYNKRFVHSPPKTFEDIFQFCEDEKKMFLFESVTFDSLVIWILEWLWCNGINLEVNDNNKGGVAINKETREKMVKVLDVLKDHLHGKKNIIPARPTINPDRFKEFGINKDGWAFARHWYSTLIYYLEKNPSEVGHIGIMPIPPYSQNVSVPPFSTWGEWYLGISKGTENAALAVNLIENLMTSRKVVERALKGAGLPPITQFYRTYGDVRCFGTDKTFNEIRREFFGNTKTRTSFSDYRTLARVLDGVAQSVISNPYSNLDEILKNSFSELGWETDRSLEI